MNSCDSSTFPLYKLVYLVSGFVSSQRTCSSSNICSNEDDPSLTKLEYKTLLGKS